MNYSSVSHVAHDSYPSQGGYPGAGPPPPPPRPGFEQGYMYGPGPDYDSGYQGYFSDTYPPPQVAHVHHSGPNNYPFQQQPYGRSYGQSYDYSYDNGLSSSLRACLAAICCCCVLEQCCIPW